MPALPICTGTVCSTSHGASSDGLRSYGVAQRAILPDVRHRTSGYSNNRAQDSHRPIRRGERQIQKFKSGSQAQQFLSAYLDDLRSFAAAAPSPAGIRLSMRSCQGVPDLATGDLVHQAA